MGSDVEVAEGLGVPAAGDFQGLDLTEATALLSVRPVDPEPISRPGSRSEPIMTYVRQRLAEGAASVRGRDVADAVGAVDERKNIQQAISRLVNIGELRRVSRGSYALPKRTQKASATPAAPAIVAEVAEPADRYRVVDAVLESLFPEGISVSHLSEVVDWRDATAKLLRLANPRSAE